MEKHITQAELARRMGVSRKEVTKWKQAGRLIWKGKRIDYEATKRLLDATADPARAEFSKVGSNKTPLSYNDARTAKEAARAVLIQLEVKERQGILINAKEVQIELVSLITDTKNRLRSIPSTCADEIYYLKIAKKQKRKLTAEIHKILLTRIDEALWELSERGRSRAQIKQVN